MAAWIASNWLEQDRSWSFDLTAHCPLRLSTMNWLSATLVKPAEQPDQQDDGNRDPDQPEQKTFTHCVLLFPLAHINVRWELRFHGITRAESGEKQGLCERVACACVPGASPVGRSAATMFLFYCITRIERERGSRNVGSDRESCARLKMVARRRASSNARNHAASHPLSNFPRNVTQAVLPPPMSLELQLMACSTVGFPTVSHVLGRDTRP